MAVKLNFLSSMYLITIFWIVFYLYFSEGLAVGVGFGAIGKSPSATFENARSVLKCLKLNSYSIIMSFVAFEISCV